MEKQKELRLMPFTDEDMGLLTKWLRAAHVRRWYTHTDSWIEEVQKRCGEFDWIHHFLIWADDVPVGFCQYYPYWKSEEDWQGNIPLEGTYSLDYLIGEPEYLRKGFARGAVKLLAERISKEEGAKRIIVQSEEENIASRSALLSAGFLYDAQNALYILKIREDLDKIAPLFDGWRETMIFSCLQGHMGFAASDGRETPEAARIKVGDFCFFAGKPDEGLLLTDESILLVPQNEAWCQEMERVLEKQVFRASRYAIKKEPGVFDRLRLEAYVEALPDGLELSTIDEAVYQRIMAHDWSRDLCSQFKDYGDYHERGLGMAVLYEGSPVSGASSYAVYDGGIEIEIDTRRDYRNKGLASACGAALILRCLERGLYPSWDAHDLRSVALAEKLGYHMEQEYPVYIRGKPDDR